jgi:alkylated DNA repair dioxygenase AlkB
MMPLLFEDQLFEGQSLFEEQAIKRTIQIEDGKLTLWHPVFSPENAQTLFSSLESSLQWRQDKITIRGKRIPVPRTQAWYGDSESRYAYSGITLKPLEWTNALLEIKQEIETITDHHFNSVLANYYRDGNDGVSWHQDNEPELGYDPVIASLSLGETRQFQLRHTSKKHETVKLKLPHNSLLVMGGALQRQWFHQVPKTKKVVGPRINLTFRLINH